MERRFFYFHLWSWGTGISGLIRGMAILPQGNQEPSVVKDKVGRPGWARGKQVVHGMWYYFLQCFDIVGWATFRASGL